MRLPAAKNASLSVRLAPLSGACLVVSARLLASAGPPAKCEVLVQWRLVHNRRMPWQTRRMAAAPDLLAPDGSEIRVLVQVPRGSMVHCTLQPGQVTRAVQHRTVEEVWLCVGGSGQVWRQVRGDAQRERPEEVVNVEPGVALTIPL